jgi:hypothetical protein
MGAVWYDGAVVSVLVITGLIQDGFNVVVVGGKQGMGAGGFERVGGGGAAAKSVLRRASDSERASSEVAVPRQRSAAERRRGSVSHERGLRDGAVAPSLDEQAHDLD